MTYNTKRWVVEIEEERGNFDGPRKVWDRTEDRDHAVQTVNHLDRTRNVWLVDRFSGLDFQERLELTLDDMVEEANAKIDQLADKGRRDQESRLYSFLSAANLWEEYTEKRHKKSEDSK